MAAIHGWPATAAPPSSPPWRSGAPHPSAPPSTLLLHRSSSTAVAPSLHSSLNSSSPAASIPPVEQPVSGEICGGPHEPVHVRVEEKGGSSRKIKQELQLAMAEGREFEYPAMMTDDEIVRLGLLVSEVDRPVQLPLPRYATGIVPPGLAEEEALRRALEDSAPQPVQPPPPPTSYNPWAAPPPPLAWAAQPPPPVWAAPPPPPPAAPTYVPPLANRRTFWASKMRSSVGDALMFGTS